MKSETRNYQEINRHRFERPEQSSAGGRHQFIALLAHGLNLFLLKFLQKIFQNCWFPSHNLLTHDLSLLSYGIQARTLRISVHHFNTFITSTLHHFNTFIVLELNHRLCCLGGSTVMQTEKMGSYTTNFCRKKNHMILKQILVN